MKRLLLASLVSLIPIAGFAVDPNTVNRSSFIAGGTQTGCIQATYIDKVMTGVTTSGGVLVLYNSSWTNTSPVISSFTIAVGNPLDFDNTKVKGICYQAVLPTNGVNIIYKQ